MKPSDRPVSRTPVPLASIARRAARIAFDRERELEQRIVGVAGRVLDRDPGDPGRHRASDVGRDAVRLDREPAFEVGVDRQVDARGDRRHVAERLVEGDRVVGPSETPGEARARRSERVEAETAQGSARSRRPTGWASRNSLFREGHGTSARDRSEGSCRPRYPGPTTPRPDRPRPGRFDRPGKMKIRPAPCGGHPSPLPGSASPWRFPHECVHRGPQEQASGTRQGDRSDRPEGDRHHRLQRIDVR